MFIMGGVLAYYNLKIFAVFFIGSVFYFVWVTLFLKRRAALDYKRFSEVSQEQSKVIELINGMQEIKLHSQIQIMLSILFSQNLEIRFVMRVNLQVVF
jgi:ATP-binding cassette subfamily B protein